MTRRTAGDITFFLAAAPGEAEPALDAARRSGAGVEFSLFDTRTYIDGPGALAPLRALALRPKAVPLSAHGPIYDLNLGSPEPFVREFTAKATAAALRAAREIGAARMVIHSGFNPLLPRGVEASWCETAAETLRELAPEAKREKVDLLVENFFEEDPSTLVRLADSAPDVGLCFDLAHARLRSKVPFGEWIEAFGDRVREFHLNDCDGRDDLHWSLGRGVCDVVPFLESIASGPRRDVPVVLEMSIERATTSLAYLAERGFRPRAERQGP